MPIVFDMQFHIHISMYMYLSPPRMYSFVSVRGPDLLRQTHSYGHVFPEQQHIEHWKTLQSKQTTADKRSFLLDKFHGSPVARTPEDLEQEKKIPPLLLIIQ